MGGRKKSRDKLVNQLLSRCVFAIALNYETVNERKNHTMFKNRIEAGTLLAARLNRYANGDGVVLAVPRGGVPVAYVIAKELNLPVDIMLTKKIGHPANKEYAIGATSLSDYFITPDEYFPEEYIQQELKSVRHRLSKMQRRFRGIGQPVPIADKTVILVDDGIATGDTLLAAVNVLRKEKPEKIVVAAPVASRSSVNKLSAVADEVVTVETPPEFHGVGVFYEDFTQVTDSEVLFYLNQLKMLRKAG